MSFLRVRHDRWLSLGLLLGLMMVGAGLRMYLLGDKAVWWDEAYTLWVAHKAPLRIILEQTAQHPPLYYLFLHFWIGLVGQSEYAARFLPVLFGIATLPAAYRLGTVMGGRAVGWGAALFLAVAPLHIHYSQEIRMYSCASLLATLSLLACLRFIDRPTARSGSAYVLATSAMLYLHHGTALLLAVENVVFAIALWDRGRKLRRLRAWIVGQVVTLATLAPWLAIYFRHRIERAGWPAMPPVDFIKLSMTLLPLGVSANLDRYLWPTLAFTGLVVLGMGTLAIKRSGGCLGARLMPLVGLTVAPGLLYVLSLPRSSLLYTPRVVDRYFLVLLPLYAVALAAGCGFIARRGRGLGAIAVVFIAIAASSQLRPYYASRHLKYDLRALGQFVQAYARPADAVVLNPDSDWPVYEYYLGPGISLINIPFGEQMDPARAAFWLGRAHQAQTVWLIETREVMSTDPSGAVRANLASRFSLVGDFDYGDSRLSVLSRRSPGEVFAAGGVASGHSLRVAGLQLLHWGLGPPRVKAGNSLYSWELWTTDAATAIPESRLVLRSEHSGVLFRSANTPLLPSAEARQDGAILSQQRVGVPCSAPPGRYDASLKLISQGKVLGILPLGSVWVTGVEGAYKPGHGLVPLDVELDHGIHLTGFELQERAVHLGGVLDLVLQWTSTEMQNYSYSVFVHLMDDRDRVVAQHDGIPAAGMCPTTSWGPGETVADRHKLPLPEGMGPGQYRIVAGLYRPHTGQRVPVLKGQQDRSSPDGVLVGSFTVAP